MAFELLFGPGRDDQIGDLRRQETAQPAHTLDLTDLISHTLFELLVELRYLLRSLTQFIEQTRVLDCDQCLVRECCGQLYLLLGERTHRLALQNNDANWLAFAKKRNAKYSAKSGSLLGLKEGEFGISKDIGHMNRFSFQYCTSDNISPPCP